jgi:hypothetical protein
LLVFFFHYFIFIPSLFLFFFSLPPTHKNTTKLETGATPTLAWQTRCPTCRVFFCLKDLSPTGPLHSTPSTAAATAAATSQEGVNANANATEIQDRNIQPNPPKSNTDAAAADGDDDEEVTALAIALSLERGHMEEEIQPSTASVKEEESAAAAAAAAAGVDTVGLANEDGQALVHTAATAHEGGAQTDQRAAEVDTDGPHQQPTPTAAELRRLRLARFEDR